MRNKLLPLLFIAPETRVAYTNEPDSMGLFRPCGSLYAGRLPEDYVLEGK
jgi:hypothetical protein